MAICRFATNLQHRRLEQFAVTLAAQHKIAENPRRAFCCHVGRLTPLVAAYGALAESIAGNTSSLCGEWLSTFT